MSCLAKIIFRKSRSIKEVFSLMTASLLTIGILNSNAICGEKHWVGTWACAPYKATTNTPPTNFDNYTLRQIVRVSIGGDTVRVRFSNITSANAVTINSVNIAVSPDGTKSAIDASTITKLKFKGDSSVTIGAKTDTTSDPVAFALKPSARIAITIYYGKCTKSDDMTFHYGSRTNSYYMSGNKTSSVDFSGSTAIERWFTISGIDVYKSDSAAAVACFGNSITDGRSLSGGLQNRWTDMFSEKLLANQSTQNVGVLNLGIGATNVLTESNGADAGIVRFTHDILGQAGLKWVIIFYGVNDINANATSNAIIAGYKQLIAATHAKNLKVYMATITPFQGNSYYTDKHETVRTEINKWIRSDKTFDGFLDFDSVIRDPSKPTQMQQALQDDGLHPNAAGYKKLGESVDVKHFELTPVSIKSSAGNYSIENNNILSGSFDGSHINFIMPSASFVSLKLYSMHGKEICELAGSSMTSGNHSVNIKNVRLSKGMYVYHLKAGNLSKKQIIFY
jgi:lysophospholipase L1-like esterase